MWPWEHAIVGYLAYSLFVRLVYREPPGGLEALTVVVASVLPDVIDKPLAWEFGVFESGYALGHSIFVAVPLSIVVGLVARRVGRTRAGLAFGVGYLLHLPGDVLDAAVRGDGTIYVSLVLWPVRRIESPADHTAFADEFWRLFENYHQEFLTGEPSTYLWIQVGLAGAAALVWLADGAPVLRECLVGVKRLLFALVDAGRRSWNDVGKRR
ncbi:metal-dependent hydrolase [Halopiger goleimassiliensis]|uniref:metal-dependent hydrolase n=1 Tax=Halopiger goleimassiliensis TaxID=1293048 RepID=UPI0006782398|nr:metal-dependent hydrolase [Halopiger goleimassiliensis]